MASYRNIRYVREGPNREHYGINPEKNAEIDSHRRSIASNQRGNKGRRKHLESRVGSEGGTVHWDKDARDDIVLPYTKKEHNNLVEREERVVSMLKEFSEKYHVQIPNELKYDTYLEQYITGQSDFQLAFSATGQPMVIKREDAGRPLTLLEANSVLRNLERYAKNEIKKHEHKNRHGEKSELEAKVSVVLIIAGLGGGFLFLSPSITGAVVGTANPASGYMGFLLFLVGVFGVYMYARKEE
ncbi:MAG: hypothetical protein ABIJ21_02815 [Nanoarchaeota archaeon]